MYKVYLELLQIRQLMDGYHSVRIRMDCNLDFTGLITFDSKKSSIGFSRKRILNISIAEQTVNITRILRSPYPTEYSMESLKWPMLSMVFCQSHRRIASEWAWMRSTPKVETPSILINLLYPIFRVLNHRNEVIDTASANIMLQSETNVKTYPL